MDTESSTPQQEAPAAKPLPKRPRPSGKKITVVDVILVLIILMPFALYAYTSTHRTDSSHGKIGTPVEQAGTTYVVKRASARRTIGDPRSNGATAKGRFVVVKVKFTNHTDRSWTFDQSMVRFVAKGGSSYATSGMGLLALGSDSIILKQIQPGRPVTGSFVFDVPAGKVAGGKLKFNGAGSKHAVEVDLEL